MKPPTFAPVYLSLFPHLAKIANDHGYALAAHGSVVRDMDLVAIPWTDEATEAEALMQAIADYLKLFHDIWGTEIHGPEAKPHGRISWLLATGFGSAIDLSVMPRIKQDNGGEDVTMRRHSYIRLFQIKLGKRFVLCRTGEEFTMVSLESPERLKALVLGKRGYRRLSYQCKVKPVVRL